MATNSRRFAMGLANGASYGGVRRPPFASAPRRPAFRGEAGVHCPVNHRSGAHAACMRKTSTRRSNDPQIGPPRTAADRSALLDILSATFNFPREHAARYQQLIGPKNFRAIRAHGSIVGGCGLIHMGQFFGGRSVPMTGIAAVGIAPEHRGTGLATTLMPSVVKELHGSGMALSALYPATWPLYQRVGYQLAGTRYEIRIALKSLRIRPRPASLEVRPISAKDQRAIEDLYRQRVAHSGGPLDRT